MADKRELKTPSMESEGKGDGHQYGRKPRTTEPIPIAALLLHLTMTPYFKLSFLLTMTPIHLFSRTLSPTFFSHLNTAQRSRGGIGSAPEKFAVDALYKMFNMNERMNAFQHRAFA